MSTILLKIATRSRPDRFQPVLDRCYEYLSGRHNLRAIISCDTDDPTMNNDAMRAHVASKPGAEIFFNPPPQNKISATNANIPADGWDILINLADDFFPVAQNYDDIVAQDMAASFPDGDGCLWYPDSRNDRICTLSVMGNAYYRRFGYIYHPEFVSLFADDWYTLVAQSLGKLAQKAPGVFVHGWTQWTGTDELHWRNSCDEVKERDRQAFNRLRASLLTSSASARR